MANLPCQVAMELSGPSRGAGGRIARRLGWWCLSLAWCLGALVGPAAAQEELLVEEGPLIDQQPFDLIHLTEDAGGGTYAVFPLALPNRRLPDNPPASTKIPVVLKQFPDRRYQIAWKWIDSIELYEARVLQEARQRLDDKDFSGAFQNLSFLMRHYPHTPGLDQLRAELLFSSLAGSFSNNQLEQTLSTLEELRRSVPQFREEAVLRALNNVARTLVERLEQRGQLLAAKQLLARLKSAYGSIEVVQHWEERIRRQAEAKQREAEEHFQAKRYRQAFNAAASSLSILPDHEGSRRLIGEINRVHSLVRVAVMQRSRRLDPASLLDWPARRSGLLAYQPLFQFLQTGNEGGNYAFALGKHRLSDDRQQLILSLDPKPRQTLTAFGLAQWLLDRAEPGGGNYDPSWAAIMESVEVKGNQIVVNLQRPHVLPYALMQWTPSADAGLSGWLPGAYQLEEIDGPETVFTLRPEVNRTGQPVEIVEVFYEDPRQAVNDLLSGRIDLIDQLYPADVKALSADARLRMMSYALPTTHMLVPVSDHAYLSNVKFRRALLYATDREGMLRGELLNSSDPRDGRVVSGPFPIGQGDSDPLAYAYNAEVRPIDYNPQLAKLLTVIAHQEAEQVAKQRQQPIQPLEKLVVGCPDFEFARVAVQALIQQWAVIGLQAEMRVLTGDESADPLHHCDLLYVMATMWEPATDIERLLGGDGPTRSDDPFVVQSLQRIREARNWREVRLAMQEMHRMVAFHLPLLPLWQVTDRFAVRRSLRGINDRPVSLYQDVANWRIEFGEVASR